MLKHDSKQDSQQLVNRLVCEWQNIKQEIADLSKLSSIISVKRSRANEILDRIYTNIETNINDGSSPSVYSYIMDNPSNLKEFAEINRVLQQYKNAYTTSRQKLVEDYFRTKFSQLNNTITNINFVRKTRGVQLGDIMTIKYKDSNRMEQKIKFYIKTHQSGSRQTGERVTSSTRAVNPKELLIYKFFEYTGFGPKTHFIVDPTSVGGFYIATQDVEFTKFPTKKEKIFKRYDQLADHYDSLPANTDKIAEQALTRIDIFSRILAFTDTNRDNFGRVTITLNSHTRFKWKIIDFRAPGIGFHKKENIFTEFMYGNTQYHYTGFQAYLLVKRSKQEKITSAMQIFEEFEAGKLRYNNGRKMPVLEALNLALTEVKSYIQENARPLGLAQNVSETLSGLEQYVQQVTANYQTLKKGIENKQREFNRPVPTSSFFNETSQDNQPNSSSVLGKRKRDEERDESNKRQKLD